MITQHGNNTNPVIVALYPNVSTEDQCGTGDDPQLDKHLGNPLSGDGA